MDGTSPSVVGAYSTTVRPSRGSSGPGLWTSTWGRPTSTSRYSSMPMSLRWMRSRAASPATKTWSYALSWLLDM